LAAQPARIDDPHASARDPLVTALVAARRSGRVLSAEFDGDPLPVERAGAIARLAYRTVEDAGASRAGWKLGLTDSGAQSRLGSAGPFVAPVYSDRLLRTGDHVSLSVFAQPRVEAEFGVVVSDGGVRVAPCMEIADCHFAGWELSLGRAIADFGLQGAVVVGRSVPLAELDAQHRVVVRCNGHVVLEGEAALPEAVERAIRLVPPSAGADEVVAAGRITALAPLTAGVWEADFGALGSVSVDVRA
jgi:2-keto-4-pentenoate hydratase